MLGNTPIIQQGDQTLSPHVSPIKGRFMGRNRKITMPDINDIFV